MSPRENASVSNLGSTDRERLGNLLREAREYLKLSQDEVARFVAIPRSAISLIETGQRKVDALELQKFATIYRRPISFFAGKTSESSADLPADVAHVARAAASLSPRDREELSRFAEFLRARAEVRRK